jgi:hypothetical protein
MTQSTIQRLAFAISIMLVVAWYWNARSRAPSVASVNGTYANACCSELKLQDGMIVAGQTRVPFRLEYMKFGLTAYSSKRLEVDGTRVLARPSADESALLFGKGGKTVTVCGDARCDQEYVFTRH